MFKDEVYIYHCVTQLCVYCQTKAVAMIMQDHTYMCVCVVCVCVFVFACVCVCVCVCLFFCGRGSVAQRLVSLPQDTTCGVGMVI